MGARIRDVQNGFIYCERDILKGCDIQLDYPSVGATENIMLASVFSEGETYIRNAAKEPEIINLQNYLKALGVDISGAGTDAIRIRGGKKKLWDAEHAVIPDRIVTGTYMVAAAITGGDLFLKNIMPEHLSSVISNLKECGCNIAVEENALRISGPVRPDAVDIIRTLPYPGFPTDMQPQMVALLSVAQGTSIIVETIFENRYKHVEELHRMGADIKLDGRLAVIKGVGSLKGANVCARDLRGGAALIIAGMTAEGETVITGARHIDRGYEEMEKKLSGVGALIKRDEN